jgi:two-component system, cell cycle sensor histidine kinase PleC
MNEKNEHAGVLVVDDEPQILTSICDLLEDDFVVSTAGDAETALRMLAHQEVAVVLSDQRMPGISGDQFLNKAKELSGATRVLITGYSDIEALVRAVNNGQIYAYVAKPWDAKEFKVTVGRAAEHYQLVQEVRQSERRFRALFEEAPVGYVEIDKNSAITAANRAALALLGYPHDDLSGRCLWDFIGSEFRRDGRLIPDYRFVGDSAGDIVEQEFHRRDGACITVELHQTLIRNPVGDGEGFRAAMLDITARKLAEQTARKYALELEIKNEELEQTLQRANEAVAVKSKFLAKMSHELRTPLNGIIGLSEVLHDELAGELQPLQKEYIGDVLASGHHLLALVNNLLDLERVELGKMVFWPQAVDLGPLLAEVRDVLRTVAAENQITVSVNVDSSLGIVTTDPVRLRQIVYNYLSNAIKFSPPEALVQVRAVPHEDESFRIEVDDSGPGIKSEQIAMIFSDFHQLEVTRKAPSQGAGLGLSLTKRIVEAQGGTVGVRSVPGEGTTFYAVLPNRQHPPVEETTS